jgi:hypothetical protein
MLYKYSTHYYGHGLAKLGLFRIGTLEDYRKTEHGLGISDPTEGEKTISVDIISEHYKTGSDVPKSLSELGIVKTDSLSKNIYLEEIHVKTNFHSKNLFIWCGSYERSKDVMTKFKDADTCVEIFDVERFIAVLCQIMSLNDARFLGIFKVVYQNRNEKWVKENDSLGLHPALIKGESDEGQKEVRAIWEPINDVPINPIHGRCGGLSNYCRVVDL